MNDKHHQAEGFFYQPKTIQWILRVFYALCIVLVLADFIVHRHIITEAERIPAFYALYGFVACVVLVLIASQMRKYLMRDEEYYEESSDVEAKGKDLKNKRQESQHD